MGNSTFDLGSHIFSSCPAKHQNPIPDDVRLVLTTSVDGSPLRVYAFTRLRYRHAASPANPVPNRTIEEDYWVLSGFGDWKIERVAGLTNDGNRLTSSPEVFDSLLLP